LRKSLQSEQKSKLFTNPAAVCPYMRSSYIRCYSACPRIRVGLPRPLREAVVRAPPDGHTLLIVDASPTVNVTLYDKLNFDFVATYPP
jgi:hypothetical protein